MDGPLNQYFSVEAQLFIILIHIFSNSHLDLKYMLRNIKLYIVIDIKLRMNTNVLLRMK